MSGAMMFPRLVVRNLRRCFVFVVLIVCAFIISSWMNKKNWVERWNIVDMSGSYLTQDDLTSFAQQLKVDYKIIGNSVELPENSGLRLTHHEVILTNKGQDFQGRWQIFFNQINFIEPHNSPYPYGLNLTKYDVMLRHWNGQLYSFEPLPSFGIFKSGSIRVIRFYARCCHVLVTDSFPNWYIVSPGLYPAIIASTVGEPDQFVHTHDTAISWKRSSVSDEFDLYNPPTTTSRYKNDAVKDLGHAPLPIIPSPVNISVYNRESFLNFMWKDDWVVVSPSRFDSEAELLTREWSLQRKATPPTKFYIQFVEERVQVEAHGVLLPPDECYHLAVSPKSGIIFIKASHEHGAFYAVQSLLALVDKEGNIPEVVITDGPRYKYRGIMLDVARNFHSKESVMRVIDVMAMYKMNKLHLHLTDDEGWRIEIPDLKELTELGASRCHEDREKECLPPFLGSGPYRPGAGTGYYTVKDYRDILRHAVSRHVEVIPEVDVPAHSYAAVKSMEARMEKFMGLDKKEAVKYLLTDLNDRPKYKTVQGFMKNIANPCIHSTYIFVRTVVQAIAEMHNDISPLRVIHLGGDEVPKGAWARSDICKKFPHSDDHSLQKMFGVKIAKIVSSLGLDLGCWEDSFLNKTEVVPRKTFPQRNVYAYAWSNIFEQHQLHRAYSLANAGYKVVLTPATHTYLDHPYDSHPDERGLTWATRFINTKKVFELIPENFYLNVDTFWTGLPLKPCGQGSNCPPLTKRGNIEGIQGTLFGELIRSEFILDYMLLPRMLALAERAWHAASWEFEPDTERLRLVEEREKDWVKFANTLGYRELRRLDKLGYHYRIPSPGAIISDKKILTSLTFPGLEVEMSQDNGHTWQIVDKENPPLYKDGTVLRTKAVSRDRYSMIVPISDTEFRVQRD